MTEPLVRHCGWCQPMPETPPGVLVTTGICDKCAAALLADDADRRIIPESQSDREPFTPRGGTFYGHYGV